MSKGEGKEAAGEDDAAEGRQDGHGQRSPPLVHREVGRWVRQGLGMDVLVLTGQRLGGGNEEN